MTITRPDATRLRFRCDDVDGDFVFSTPATLTVQPATSFQYVPGDVLAADECGNGTTLGFGSVTNAALAQVYGPINYSSNIGNLAMDLSSCPDGWLRNQYPPNGSNGPTITWGRSTPFTGTGWFCYDWQFDPGFQFEGATSGSSSTGKMPGFAGGSLSNGSGGGNAQSGWSARPIWRGVNGGATLYLYHPDKGGTFGTDVPMHTEWGVNSAPFNWPIGTPFKICMAVDVNTTGTSNDARVRVWVDTGSGPVLRLDVTNGVSDFQGRLRTNTSYGIDQFAYSTFYGGSGVAWHPGFTTHSRFRNLNLSNSQLWTP